MNPSVSLFFQSDLPDAPEGPASPRHPGGDRGSRLAAGSGQRAAQPGGPAALALGGPVAQLAALGGARVRGPAGREAPAASAGRPRALAAEPHRHPPPAARRGASGRQEPVGTAADL